MEGEWTPERKRMALAAIGVMALFAIMLFAVSLLENRGAERCDGILLAEAKDDCWRQVAMEMRDGAYCDRIGDFQTHDACITDVMQGPGGESPEMCGRMNTTATRDACYNSVASTQRNATYCRSIKTVTIRDNCYSTVSSLATDPSACNLISDSIMRSDCNNRIYSSLAAERKDPALCSRMLADDAAVYSYLVDTCILNVAADSGDTSMCSSIRNSTLRTQCSGGPVDVSSCQPLSDENARNVCFYTAAIQSGDPDNCDLVPGSSMRDNCYYQFAQTKHDSSLCARISSPNLKNACESGT